MNDKVLEQALKEKLAHLTVDGARDFWNEVCDDLNSMIKLCERAIRDYRVPDLEVKKAQIQLFVCERLKKVPEAMVERIKKQLAEDSAGDEKAELDIVNFLSSAGRKTEE